MVLTFENRRVLRRCSDPFVRPFCLQHDLTFTIGLFSSEVRR